MPSGGGGGERAGAGTAAHASGGIQSGLRGGAGAEASGDERRPRPFNVVDSSAWLEYFADGPNADVFAAAIEATDRLVVPTVVLLEVHRRILQQRDEATALEVSAQLRRGRLVALSADIAVEAALVGRSRGLPLADSIVYATAEASDAVVWTQDADFESLPNVHFVPHRRQ